MSNFTNPIIDEPLGITVGPDGALWFSNGSNGIGRITTEGVVSNFTGTGSSGGITTGRDGALWFPTFGTIERMTTAGCDHQLPASPEAPGLQVDHDLAPRRLVVQRRRTDRTDYYGREGVPLQRPRRSRRDHYRFRRRLVVHQSDVQTRSDGSPRSPTTSSHRPRAPWGAVLEELGSRGGSRP